jgi:hypothetical protein
MATEVEAKLESVVRTSEATSKTDYANKTAG